MAALQPLQERYAEIRRDEGYLSQVLREGKERAAAVANATLGRVKGALGFLSAA